jgi:enamine deaminase RidA (YjgF/YER057c/UK114 family)
MTGEIARMSLAIVSEARNIPAHVIVHNGNVYPAVLRNQEIRVSILDRVTEVPGNVPGFGYAHAVTVTGRLAFLSGQVAFDTDGGLVGPGDLAAQTEQALNNVHRIAQSLGADWPDVVKFTWYVVDAGQVQIIRDVRDRLIRPALGDRPNPASSLVQVAALFRPEFLVEVEAIVALPE